ncbi:MAG: hypothetical protein ABIA66_00585, partial [Candidatus Omnitrophota bacterium]
FQDVLPGYELYLAPGIIIGFYFSWFMRDKQSAIVRLVINTGIVAVFAWMLYSVANSSWIYRDIILILVKAGILLEIILSFHTWSYSFLGYMQALSLPLFMGFPTFIEEYHSLHAILVSVYLVCWAAILKLKFYESFNLIREKKLKKRWSFLVSAVFFVIIVVIAWMLFLFLILGKIEEGGEFLHKEMRYLEDEESLEKMYYDEQEQIQEKIAGVVDEIQSKKEREGIIENLNSLVTGQNVAEIKASELELIDYLKRAGPGLDPALQPNQLIVLIEKYFDKKIQINMKRIKNKIIIILKRNPFRFLERIRIIRRMNKTLRAKFYIRVRDYSKQIRNIVNESRRVEEEIKKDLRELTDDFKDWKALELSRQKMEELKEQIVPLEEQPRKQFENLVSDIEKVETSTDFKEVERQVDLMKHTAPKELQELVNKAEEILDILQDILLQEAVKELKEELERANIPIDEMQQVEEELEKIKDLEELQQLEKKIEEEQEIELEKEEPPPPEELKEKKLLRIKIIPEYLEIPLGEEGQLIAVGEYDDGSQEDLTSLVEWIGTDDSIATIAAGLVSTHSLGRIEVIAEYKEKEMKSSPAVVVVIEPRLVEIILTPEKSEITVTQSVKLKAEGVYTDSSRKDITSLVGWEITKKRVLKIDKGLVKPLSIGETTVYAEHKSVRSNPAYIKVKITLGWLLWLLLKIILFLLLLIIILLIILYLLSQRKRDYITDGLSKDPRGFIIKLYMNLKHILFLFGLRHKDVLPPLAYGRLVEKNYPVRDNLFLEFTMKYAEAKYSRHVLENTNALASLDDYNKFLKIVLEQESKVGRLFKHLVCLLKRVPLFVNL